MGGRKLTERRTAERERERVGEGRRVSKRNKLTPRINTTIARREARGAGLNLLQVGEC